MVKLQLIMDRAERNMSQEMCLPNLVKSTGELAVLCDASASLIVYPSGEDQPVVCPSHDATRDVLARHNSVAESERSQHKLDGVEFIQKRVSKAKTKLYNIHRQNCEQVARLQNDVQDPVVPAPEHVLMVEPLAMVPPPPPPTLPAQVTVPAAPLPEEDARMIVDPPAYNASRAPPMTLDGEPRYGSYLFEVMDACDVNGDGSGLPTDEELLAVFVKAGISTAPQPK